MRLLVGLTVCLALAAGSAMAQGSFNSGRKPTGWDAPSYKPKRPASPYASPYAPAPSAATPARPKTYGAPEAPTPPAFKPYEPWKPNTSTTSLYGPDGKKKR